MDVSPVKFVAANPQSDNKRIVISKVSNCVAHTTSKTDSHAGASNLSTGPVPEDDENASQVAESDGPEVMSANDKAEKLMGMDAGKQVTHHFFHLWTFFVL